MFFSQYCPKRVNRTLLIWLALAAGLTGCSGGGPSQAESSACAPFLHVMVPTTSKGSGVAVAVPTKWVTQLLDSGDPHLVQDAKTFESDHEGLVFLRAIVSECGRLGG
jgi:hypothetical protein